MKLFAALVIAAACTTVHAVNKCTTPGGSVVFQDAPCSIGQKADSVKVWKNTPSESGGPNTVWRFERTQDSMTGRAACFAYSPSTIIIANSYRDTNEARLVLSAQPAGNVLAVLRLESSSKSIFHNDLEGMGIKVDPGSFHPLTIKVGQNLVSTPKAPTLIEELATANSFRLRIRFWPYDKLVDSGSVTTSGMKAALTMATECAKSL